MLLKLYPENPNPRYIKMIIDCLENDGVIIFPTDTIYAIGCSINSSKALERIARIKGVKKEKANFSIIFHDLSMLSEFTRPINNDVFKLMKRNLPGAFTFILEANNNVPKIFKNNKKTIGIRIPDQPIITNIVRELGCPIITTSIVDDDEISGFMTDPEDINDAYSDRVDIIINTPDNRLMKAADLVRHFTGKRITRTVIIPDIPSMITEMDKQNPVKRYLLRYLNRSAMNKVSDSDGLVLLTEDMMDFVDKPVRHIVMEGIVDVETMDVDTDDQMPEKKVVLYTGTLRKIFGVMNLVKAFQSLENTDAELWICGSGDSENDINEAAKQDSRIKYFGMVDSQTALSMQRQATVLVNPRTSEGEYTKYSFPSKTMEYLLAGKCTIINRLPGIPEEYYDYVYTPDDESVESLAECISDVLSRDADILAARAKAGRDFVISQKNSIAQTKKIMDMINNEY